MRDIFFTKIYTGFLKLTTPSVNIVLLYIVDFIIINNKCRDREYSTLHYITVNSNYSRFLKGYISLDTKIQIHKYRDYNKIIVK